MDVVYSKDMGVLYVMAAVSNTTKPVTLRLTIPEGVSTDIDGVKNLNSEKVVQYAPSGGSSTIGQVAGWGMLGSLAMSFGAAAISPTGSVGIGAINFAGFVQTFYMSGSLPITNMPQNYKDAAASLVWVGLNPPIGPAAPTTSEEQIASEDIVSNISQRFPYPPVTIVSIEDGDPEYGSDVEPTLPGVDQGDQGISPPLDSNNVIIEPLPEHEGIDDQGNPPNPFTEEVKPPAEDDEGENGKESDDMDDGDENAKENTTDENSKEDTDDEESSNINNVQPDANVDESTTDENSNENLDDIESNETANNDEAGDTDEEESNIQENDKEDKEDNKGDDQTGVAEQLFGGNLDDHDYLEYDTADSSSQIESDYDEGEYSKPLEEDYDYVYVEVAYEDEYYDLYADSTHTDYHYEPSDGEQDDIHGEDVTQGDHLDSAQDIDDSALIDQNIEPNPAEPPENSHEGNSETASGEEDYLVDSEVSNGDGDEEHPTSNSSPSEDTGNDYHVNHGEKGPGNDNASNNENEPPEIIADYGDDPSEADNDEGDLGEAAPGRWQGEDEDVHPNYPSKNNKDGLKKENLDKGSDRGSLKGHNNGSLRKLLLDDPLTALTSSGFSYVVTTATPGLIDGNQSISLDEIDRDAIGASVMSRIRAIQTMGAGKDADSKRLDVLWNVLFWSAMLICAITVLHCAILVGLCIFKVEKVPKMLHLPRIELLAFMMIMPMISAAGAAALQSTSAEAVAAGICFGIILPFGFLLGAGCFLVFVVIRPTISKRRAVYVLKDQDGNAFSVPSESQIAWLESSGLSRESGSVESSNRSSSDIQANLNTDLRDSSITRSEDSGSEQQQDPPATLRSKTMQWMYRWVVCPLFGFSSRHRNSSDSMESTWLGRAKQDAIFVKRYGCLFEDAHGPPVIMVNSRYDAMSTPLSGRETVGGGILVSLETERPVQILQTYGILFAVMKMVLFAVIINGPGGVNNIAQVLALLLVALLHMIYLRVCVPYRLRVELAAEVVAAVCDFAVFVCGMVLITKEDWTEGERNSMGIAMIALQAIGFLVFITVRVCLALRTAALTVMPAVKSWLPSRRQFTT